MSTICVSKKALNKHNIVRIYAFSIILGIVVFLTTLGFGIAEYNFLLEAVQMPLLISLLAVLLFSTVATYALSAKRKSSYYKKYVYSFWAVFCAIMMLFTFFAESPAKAIICYWIMMMSLGFVPVFKFKRFMTYWGIQLVAVVGLMFVHSFSSEGIISLITVNIMSILLNMTTYNLSIKNLSIKASLSDAITQAETDPMTQLLNRRGLSRRVGNIWPHCVRQKSNVAIIMMDIDYFKKYNDSFGHAAGDECIKSVTSMIRSSVRRQTDYAARVGGEEFLVMLTGIEPKQALQWSLSLKKKIEDLRIPHSRENFLPYVTVSMGLTCYQTSQGKSFEEIREEADKALYDAKYNGRACLSYNKRIYSQITPYQYKRRANG